MLTISKLYVALVSIYPMNFELRQGCNQSNLRSLQGVNDWDECAQPTPPHG